MAIAELFDMVKICSEANKKLKVNPNDINAVSSLFSKAKSISAQASKYVMEYPVACSTSITDYKTALAITKQVEFDCARFVILASGLNPIVSQQNGDSIHAHINNLVSSYESLTGFKVSITPASQEIVDSCEGYIESGVSKQIYKSFNEDTETTQLAFGMEASNSNKYINMIDEKYITRPYMSNGGETPDNLGDVERIIGPRPQDPGAEPPKPGNEPIQPGKEPDPNDIPRHTQWEIRVHDYDVWQTEKKLHDEWEMKVKDVKDWEEAKDNFIKRTQLDAKTIRMDNQIKISEINGKLGKSAPTIVNIKMYVQAGDGTDRAIDFPLAIKATLQYVDQIDIKEMLGQVDSAAKKLFKFFQLTSGEIKFFKDFLFALDSVKGDVERERVVGNTPFFRRLMSNKSRYRMKTVSQHIPILKDFIAKKRQQDLPMCTIVIDESELSGIHLRLSDCLKNRAKYIDPILDTYMLLGLGIVDSDNGVIHFFYSGEDYPVTCDITKIGNNDGTKDISSDLSKALANMSRLITKH